jgi:hypothetical protein
MGPRIKSPPRTPAQRQAKRRAVKRGEWHTFPDMSVDQPPGLPPLSATNPNPALPAPNATPALPAPPTPPVTAIQKAVPADAARLALPESGGLDDAWRLSLPPAVAARLRSLVERQDAGKPLTPAERAEALGLIDIAEFFVVQRLRRRLAA